MASVVKAVLDRINEVNCLTERVKKRRREFLEGELQVVSTRSRLFTESWKETEGEPVAVRRAKGLQKLAEGLPVVIRQGELIVGSWGESVRTAWAFPDWKAGTVLDAFANKAKEKFTIAEDYYRAECERLERDKLLEDAAYWKDRCPWEHSRKAFRALWGSRIDDYEGDRLVASPFGVPVAVWNPSESYRMLLQKGLNGIISEVKERLNRVAHFDWETAHKAGVWQAMIIACQALITYAGRHAELARQLARREADEQRKRELERIADICDWVPANPARSFHEALQSLQFVRLGLEMETGMPSPGLGRLDQILYPFWEKDLREGRISRQEAAELLACVWVKLNESTGFNAGAHAEMQQQSNAATVVVGGVDEDGRDATNELSYLILEVDKQMNLPLPNTTVRYHESLPEELLIKAIQLNRAVGGKPQLVNDKIAILNLSQWGVPLAEARDWAILGCNSIDPSKDPPVAAGSLNLAKVLELTLNNGIDPRTGKQLGMATGDPREFTSFQELYEALKKQHSFVTEALCNAVNVHYRVVAETYAIPFHSALSRSAIEKGLDCCEGGKRYPQLEGFVDLIGRVNVADSLASIKKLVFEDKAIGMAELLEALAVNFEGKEKLRALLLAAPKYGNDDDYVDQIAVDVFKWTRDILGQKLNVWGYPYQPFGLGQTRPHFLGKVVGALPDGRQAYEPLADGAVSPMRGMDHKGPTAALNSVAKLDLAGHRSTILNQKFFRSAVVDRDGIKKLLALIKTYFDRYGYHIQFNCLDLQTLLDAKKHPEKYRDLMVRVGGFSAYFVDLSAEVQDEIIARTTQGL